MGFTVLSVGLSPYVCRSPAGVGIVPKRRDGSRRLRRSDGPVPQCVVRKFGYLKNKDASVFFVPNSGLRKSRHDMRIDRVVNKAHRRSSFDDQWRSQKFSTRGASVNLESTLEARLSLTDKNIGTSARFYA